MRHLAKKLGPRTSRDESRPDHERADTDLRADSSPRDAALGSDTAVDTLDSVRVLVVSEEVVVSTWRALRPTMQAACESIALWAVPKAQYHDRLQVVTTVIVPQQRVCGGRFEIPPDAVREMGRMLRRRALVNVAQVHSHPSDWVGHSDWDNAHSFSLRDGALSIVWPRYARELPPMDAWGVHECDATEWRRLERGEAARRIVVAPSVIDLRIRLRGLSGDSEDERGS